MIYERVVGSIIPFVDPEIADEVKAFFKEYTEKKDLAKDVIKLSLEKLEINLKTRGF